MEYEIQLIFDKIKKQNAQTDPAKMNSFGEFVYKFYNLLGHVHEIEQNQKRVQGYLISGQNETEEGRKQTERYIQLVQKGRVFWLDTIQEMQDDNNGMQLFNDNDYFTVLDYVNLLIFTINGVGGQIVNV